MPSPVNIVWKDPHEFINQLLGWKFGKSGEIAIVTGVTESDKFEMTISASSSTHVEVSAHGEAVIPKAAAAVHAKLEVHMDDESSGSVHQSGGYQVHDQKYYPLFTARKLKHVHRHELLGEHTVHLSKPLTIS